jgi:hypothetical protein
MPIINLQRSVHQVGRIRLGEQAPTSNGKTRPSKLSTFRLTSSQRQPIDAAAALYGGQATPFDNDRSDDRWQVTTDTDTIPVVIPPTHHLDQWMEAWGGGGCDRRCDGQTMTVLKGQAVDQACMCDPDNRVCKITTRLWVVLPELEALGVWRLETHGYYAAAELAGAADLCAAVTAQGRAIPARLHLEQRTRRTAGQTFRFAVPVLSVDVSLPQAKAILGQADIATGEITTPSTRQLEPPAPRAIEPPAPTPEPPQRVELPPPPPADIPAPRTADQYQADNEHDDEPQLFEETRWGPDGSPVPPWEENGPINPPLTLPDPDARPLANKQRARIMALQRTLRMGTDELRELTSQATGGRTNSLAADGGIYDTEAANLIETLDKLETEQRTKAGK